MTAWGDRAGACLKRLEGIQRPKVAEIGAGHCRMARELMERHPDLRLVLVDSYLPAEKQPARYKKTRDHFSQLTAEQALQRLRQTRAFAEHYQDRVLFLHMDSVAASRCVVPGALDLCFIDADHSYEGVKRDIAAWLPKVQRGGWLGGHDYMNRDERFDFSGVDRAVTEFSANFNIEIEADANFTWWARR